MLRGAIFDMDGVLVDNMAFHMKAFTEFARRKGVFDIDYDRVMSMNGMGIREFFNALFPPEVIEREGGVEALSSAKEAIYREIYAPDLAPAHGLIALLDDFRANGVLMAVGTSGCKANLDFVLDGLGIRSYFDSLVTSDVVARTKPAPDIYLRALSELGLAGDECLVFEDAIAGIQAASAAGIHSVGVATTAPRATLAAAPGVVLVVDDFTGVDFAKLNALI